MKARGQASSATISMAYLLSLLDAMEVPRALGMEVLQEVGVPSALVAQPAARVTKQQFAELYRALAFRLDDEMLRLFSRPLRPGALKFTCLSLLDAKSLQVALHRWANVLRVLQDDMLLEVRDEGPYSRVALVPAPGQPACKPFALDLMLKLIHGVSSWLVGRRIPLTHVHFSFARPAFAAEYQTLYPGPVHFGQAESAFFMERASLQLPLRRARHELPGFLRRAPEDWIFVSFKDELLAQRLRRHLEECLPLPATADSAAGALHVSTRTLHRHLSDEGTSFQRVKDELRRDLAIQKLTRSREPIASIGAALGFDNAASFHRAFRGWTGDTPGAYRGARRS